MIGGVVMAHQKRTEWAEELSEQLGLPITWDKINDRHETGLRCLQAGLESSASHWLIVQDDAVICRDLVAGLTEAVKVSGERIIGLYVGNGHGQSSQTTARMAAAKGAGLAWLSAPGPSWGVGIVIPTVHLPSLTRYYERSLDKNYDRRIEKWAAQAKVECWYTTPSLVEHRHGPENPSLVEGRTSITRQARWFIGVDGSAMDVDWSHVPVSYLHRLWRHVKSGRVYKANPGSSQARKYAQSVQFEPVAEEKCDSCGQRTYVPLKEQVCL